MTTPMPPSMCEPLPAVLRMPPLPRAKPRGRTWWPLEQALPLPVDSYEIEAGEFIWRVREISTRCTVYLGPGPVHLVQSTAPF